MKQETVTRMALCAAFWIPRERGFCFAAGGK